MLTTFDTSELTGLFRQLEERGKNVSRLTPAIAEMLKSAVNDVIEAEGPGWKDLADSTKQARRGTSYKILQDTGVLAASIGTESGPDWAEAYAGAAYADFHVTGTRNMPARNPFELGQFMDDVLSDASDLILQELAT